MATVEERVTAGAAFLDENYPGWLDRIDLDELRMDWCDACILGQVAGSYRAVYPNLGNKTLNEAQNDIAATFGFSIDTADHADRWPLLADAWRSYILMRRAAADGPDWDGHLDQAAGPEVTP